MKVQYTLLQKEIDPTLTVLFKETNKYHPEIISDDEGFAIVIEDWNEGEYMFVNSVKEGNRVSNEHFTPRNAKSLKTIKDLNNLWKTITGKPLTYMGSPLEKVEVGKIYPTNKCGNVIVIDLLPLYKAKVKFDNGYETITQQVNILNGSIRNPHTPRLFGVGYIGEGKYNSTDTKEAYQRWKLILQRCYDKNSSHIYNSYQNVTVCEEWKCLQIFGKWFDEQYNP